MSHDAVEPAVGPRGYTQFYRTPRARWWKGLLSTVAILAVFLLLTFLLGGVAMALDVVLGTADGEAAVRGEVSMTPLLLLSTNLAVILTAALAALLHVFLHRQPVGTLHSVTGRLRWRWLGVSALIVLPPFVVYVGLATVLDPEARWSVDELTLAFLVVVLLTTPLQAAGEEYLFRGVIQRAAGSWAAGRVASLVLGTTVSAVIFSLMHAATDLWLIVYYLVVGVTMSLVTQATGGLEAACLIHVANNTLLLLLAVLLGQVDEGFDRSTGTGGPVMLIPMAVFVLVSVAVAVLARKAKVARTGLPPASA